MEPACAQACPTDSIQFGPLTSCATGRPRVDELHDLGVTEARLYGHDPDDGVGGDGAFFLLLDEPEVYGLPPDPHVPTRDAKSMWRQAAAAAGVFALAGIGAFCRRAGRDDRGAPMTQQHERPAAASVATPRRRRARRSCSRASRAGDRPRNGPASSCGAGTAAATGAAASRRSCPMRSSAPTTAARCSSRRCGSTRSRRTCSPAAWPPAPRCSRRVRTSPVDQHCAARAGSVRSAAWSPACGS